MNQQTPLQASGNQSGTSDVNNTMRLFQMMISNWIWFLSAMIIAFTVAVIYNKYALPVYRVSTMVLLEEGENSAFPGLDNRMLEGFGIRQGSENIDNQILVFSSRSLIRKALEELPFSSDIYRKSMFKTVSYYPLTPLTLVPGPNGIPYNTEFSFQHHKEDAYRLTISSKTDIDFDTLISFGQQVSVQGYSFSILPHLEMQEVYNSGEKIYFSYYDQKFLVEDYRKRLDISTASEDGTILTLTMEGTNRSRDIIFLDKLVEVFMRENLEKKNHEALRIIEFIDEQLVDVSESLTVTENQLQEFRSKNMIMDVSAQAQQIIDQAVVLDNEKARLTLEANYYNYLDTYLSKEDNQEVPISPSTMGIEDPNLGNLMQELAGFQAEYFSNGVGQMNPLQSQLVLRIQNTKRSLRETLQGIKHANSMAMEETNQQIEKLNARASGLPVKERQLLGFERKFNLNNVLYTFLLQKRAEAQIQKASNKPDNELVDAAESDLHPIAPNKLMIYMLAFVLGGGIPLITTVLKDTINNKVSSEDDLMRITNLPIVGHIPHSRLSYNTVVLTEPQSRISEAFRSLRTRLEFFTRETKSPIIVLSSSMPGDGKTFSAINLASAYSLAGKKTVIVGFDLRRPTLAKSLGIENTAGLSSYLIGKSTLEQVIVKTEFENLHVIPSGPVPPNPAELSSSDKVREMFVMLKEKYDYIIVDSAPIGAVSDIYFTAAMADAILIAVRHGQTNRHFLKATLNEVHANGIHGLSILINDFKSNRSSYHQYSYNYKKYEYKSVNS